ncbi:chalcone isomerase family protein [Chitinibacter sp. GC72]|uniref:chalcone isomerase family protein n=1 Tax=Chitinibacter sp. GC72 TaxID=1526917 RepID=UPI0012F8FEAB|nr:chalcone isomerase family protein [Chitinibacter sp. GC72]
MTIPLVQVAHANAWREPIPQARAIGSGDLRWFGLKIYTARLWSEQSRFDPAAPAAPFALELTYHRSISREQFVKTSLDEITRLFGNRYPAATLKRWEAEMQRAFTDVKEGDQLIGVYLPNAGCRFYSRSQLLAEIRDPEFAKAFFAIWFDERTKDSGLRAQLIGGR